MASEKKTETVPPKPETGEITKQLASKAGDAVSGSIAEGKSVTLPNGVAITIKRQVTRDVLVQRDNETIFVRFEAPIYEGKKIEGGAQKDMAAARLGNVLNIVNGMQQVIIVNTVLEKNLDENYPDDAYVGRSFGITMMGKKDGKRYKTFTIFEVEATAPATPAT